MANTASNDAEKVLENTAYSAALDYLYGRINYEKIGHADYTANNYRLDRMRRLLGLLGDPHQQYPVLHIAGTKGKGTVASLLAASLNASGLRTGLYTSPHLLKLEERFVCDGQLATPEQVVELMETIKVAASKLEQDWGERATFFELTTALGMLHFAKQEVDCAVLEVGLGGRLDSTNVCTPEVAIITSISLDHQRQLGNTIPSIAGEKAGIIKPNVPTVCSAQDPQATQVIRDTARQHSSPLYEIQVDFRVRWDLPEDACDGKLDQPNLALVEFQPESTFPSKWGVSHWPVRLLGRHQASNVAAAVATLDLLAQRGWQVNQLAARNAMATCVPVGRLQLVGEQPIRVLDTAHNPASIEAGLTALDEHFPGKPRNVVFSSSHDKDVPAMLELLLERTKTLILTAFQDNPRAIQVEELRKMAENLASNMHTNCRIQSNPRPVEAWQEAVRQSEPSEIVMATGSFFLAAELLADMKEYSRASAATR